MHLVHLHVRWQDCSVQRWTLCWRQVSPFDLGRMEIVWLANLYLSSAQHKVNQKSNSDWYGKNARRKANWISLLLCVQLFDLCWELLCKWSDSLLGASRMKPFATSTTTWSSIVAPLDALLRTRCNFFKINFWEDCLGSQNWHGKTALRRKRSRCHRATPKML